MSRDDFICTGVFTAIWGAVSYLVGGIDIPLESLFVLICLDLATGIYASVVRKQVSARKLANGLIRKIMLFTVVCMAFMIDNTTRDVFHLRTFTISMLALAEGISICENIVRAGMGDIIPHQIIDKLTAITPNKEDKNK